MTSRVVREQINPLILWSTYLTPNGFNAPVSDEAQLVRFNERYALAFVNTVQRSAEWTFVAPSWCVYPKLLITLNFTALIGGTVVWQAALEELEDGDDTSSASYGAPTSTSPDVAPNLLRQISFSIDAPNVAGKLSRLRITRMGDDPSDTLDDDAYLLAVKLEEVRT